MKKTFLETINAFVKETTLFQYNLKLKLTFVWKCAIRRQQKFFIPKLKNKKEINKKK